MKRLTLVSLLPLLFVSLVSAKTFTIEQVLSAPFPSELIASHDGKRVAWLLNERGARNIWMATAPDFKGVRLTNNTKDDGVDIGQLCFTPDGRVVYTRGGDLEFLGRPDPNPGVDPAGTEQAIMIVGSGPPPRKIAEGHSAEISPKGDRVAFIRGGQVWVGPLAGGEAALLHHARSNVTASGHAWPPDGSKTAFA